MRQPDGMRGILNPPVDLPVARAMISDCEAFEADVVASITSRVMDREQYLHKMGELSAVRAIRARLIAIYKGGTT